MLKLRAVRILVAIGLAMLVGATIQPPAFATTSYQVTFIANGGTGTMPKQTVPTTGKPLTKNRFTRVGFVFTGWGVSSNAGVKYKDAAVVKPRAKLTLWAQWSMTVAAPAIAGHTIGKLIWSDEFTGAAGSQISEANWTARNCGSDNLNGGGACFNGEQQWYTPDAVALDGSNFGNAVITTTHVSSPPANAGDCGSGNCQFTSARFDTQGKVSFMYGYIEARIKMPAGGGNWPAFWALGDSMGAVGWPLAGEIDIAEEGGNQATRASSAVHYSTVDQAICCANHLYETSQLLNVANYQSDFHTYGMGWTKNQMDFYVDGQLFWSVTPANIRSNVWKFNEPFFLILNNAVGSFGGNYDGWATSQMTIDYVRAWQLDGKGAVARL
jgi:uncharacterized repeat protein (TIGR02543 family)